MRRGAVLGAVLATACGVMPWGGSLVGTRALGQDSDVPRLIARPVAARPLPAVETPAAAETSAVTPIRSTTSQDGWASSGNASQTPVMRDEAVRRTAVQEGELQWQRRSGGATSAPVQLGAPRNAAPRIAAEQPINDPFGDRSAVRQPRGGAAYASTRYQDEAGVGDAASAPPLGLPAQIGERATPFDCEAFYAKLANNPLSSIELNLSPSVDPEARTDEEIRAALLRIASAQTPVDWVDRTGRVVAHGRLTDWHNGMVFVMDEAGEEVTVSYYDLSAASRRVVTAAWGVPAECSLLEQGSVDRMWAYQTYTWTASQLCHKPLFFEDVQLERYGQTSRPIVQPFRSGAHFFLNIAAMPYNAGVYPPNECRYSLGYYRPGDCAPYLSKSLPLSARGAMFQAGAVVGTAVALP